MIKFYMTEIIEVQATNQSTEVMLPNLKENFTKQLFEAAQEIARAVATEHNLDLEEVMKCIPKPLQVGPLPYFKPTKKKAITPKQDKPKKKSEKITDYTKAETIEDLKHFKLPELKEILENNKLATSGSKPVLINRVWGILHPEDSAEEAPKKRGRKPKDKKTSNPEVNEIAPNGTNDEKDSDVEEHDIDTDNMDTIYFNDDDIVCEKSEESKELKILKNKWVFEETEDSIEFLGVLEDKSLIRGDPPDELLTLLG